MNYASLVTECPHCGVVVLFSSDSICPSCCEHGNSPVLNSHLEKIESIRQNVLLRKMRDEDRGKIPEIKPRQVLFFIIFIKLILLLARCGSGY